MKWFLYIFPFLALADNPVGWICRVHLAEYESTQNQQGGFSGSYNGKGYYFCVYKPNTGDVSLRPTLSDLGYTAFRDLSGNAAPTPPTYAYVYPLVQDDLTAVPVYANINTNGLGNLSTLHGLTPVYDSSLGNPFTVDSNFGYYTGPNNSFDYDSVTPLQNDLNYGQGQNYLKYSDDGMPFITSNSSDGNVWVKDSNGNWGMVPSSSGSGSASDVDLSPIISNQVELRNLLVSWLGANGNSWVYDSKLSLAELVSLASSLGYKVDSIDDRLLSLNSSADTIYGKLDDIARSVDSVGSLNSSIASAASSVNSEISLAANVVSENIQTGNIALGNMESYLQDIYNILYGWDNSTLPNLSNITPNFGDDSDYDLPVDDSNFDSDAGSVNSQIKSMFNSSGNPSSRLSGYRLINYLQSFIGSIPSVGRDASICSFSIDLPYIGTIQRSWAWTDFPGVDAFRAAMVFFCYVFFGIASFKMIHKTVI